MKTFMKIILKIIATYLIVGVLVGMFIFIGGLTNPTGYFDTGSLLVIAAMSILFWGQGVSLAFVPQEAYVITRGPAIALIVLYLLILILWITIPLIMNKKKNHQTTIQNDSF